MNQYTEKVLQTAGWTDLVCRTPKYIKNRYKDAMCFNDKDTDTQGFIIIINRVLIIAFKGSVELPDWIRDFDAWHVVIPYNNEATDIRVHSGFIGGYKSVRDIILSYIIANRNMIDKAFIVGHSLGGALATLCAVDIQYNIPNVDISCYTLGSPKVGNQAFVNSFNKRVPDCIRTYLKKDLVPELPPTWFGKYGYSHVGKPNPIGLSNIFEGILIWFKTHFKNSLASLATNHAISLYRQFA